MNIPHNAKGARGDLRVKTKVLDKDYPEEEDRVKACRLKEKGQARSLRLGEFLGLEKGVSICDREVRCELWLLTAKRKYRQ